MSYPLAKRENVLQSLWAFIETNYTLTEKFFIGLNTLTTDTLAEWVEFLFNDMRRKEVRAVNQDNPGNIVSLRLTTNIFVKPTDVISRIDRICDTLAELFRRCVIEIRDWVGDSSVIGKMIGQGIMADMRLPDENEYQRHMLIFTFQYVEEHERLRGQ